MRISYYKFSSNNDKHKLKLSNGMKQLTINEPLHGLPALSQVWAIPFGTDTYVLVQDYKSKNPRVIKQKHLIQ